MYHETCCENSEIIPESKKTPWLKENEDQRPQIPNVTRWKLEGVNIFTIMHNC